MLCRSIRRATASIVVLLVAGMAGATPPMTLSRASGPTPFASTSCDRAPDTEFEPAIALDPNDSQHIVAAWMQDDALGVVVAATVNGGASWTRTVLPGEVSCTTPIDNVTDPTIAIGPDGIVYVATGPQGVRTSGFTPVDVHRSLDGGLTWQPPVVVLAGVPQNLQSIVTFPDRPASAVVASAVRFDAAVIARTDDGGVTWSGPRLVRLSTPGTLALFRMVALSDDRLAMTYVECSPLVPGPCGPVMATHSSDGGATWSAPVQVMPARPDNEDRWPELAATPSGTLYTEIAEAEKHGASSIFLSRSDDSGATWSAPVQAAVQHPLGGAVPGPAMAATDGHVLLLYDDADGSVARARIVRSDDNGATWTEVFVSQPFGVKPGTNTIGDYQQIAAWDGGFAGVMVLGGPYAIDGPTDVWVARGSY